MQKRTYVLGQFKAVVATESDMYPKFYFTNIKNVRGLVEAADSEETRKAYHAIITKHRKADHSFHEGQLVFLEKESRVGEIMNMNGNIAVVQFDVNFERMTVDVDVNDREVISQIVLRPEQITDKFYGSITGERASVKMMFTNVLVSVNEDHTPYMTNDKGVIIPISNEISNITTGKADFIGNETELAIISTVNPREYNQKRETPKPHFSATTVNVKADNSDIAQILRDFVDENEIKLVDGFSIEDFVDAKMTEYSIN